MCPNIRCDGYFAKKNLETKGLKRLRHGKRARKHCWLYDIDGRRRSGVPARVENRGVNPENCGGDPACSVKPQSDAWKKESRLWIDGVDSRIWQAHRPTGLRFNPCILIMATCLYLLLLV